LKTQVRSRRDPEDRHHPGQHPPWSQRRGSRKWVYEVAARRPTPSSSWSTSRRSSCRTWTRRSRRRWGSTRNRTPGRGPRRSPRSTGFVFVTPEYNHSTSGALKNAIDFLYGEWNTQGRRVRQLRRRGWHPGGRAPAPDPCPSCRWRRCGRSRAVPAHRLRELSTFHPVRTRLMPSTATLDQVIAWSGALRPSEWASDRAEPIMTVSHAQRERLALRRDEVRTAPWSS